MLEFFSENAKAIFTIISLVVIPSLVTAKKVYDKHKGKRQVRVIANIIAAVENLIELKMHTQHHTRNKQAVQVENVVKSFAENVLNETDNPTTVEKIFPHLSGRDLQMLGKMYRRISRDVFYGPFFKKIIGSIYDDQVHMMKDSEYDRHINVYAKSSFVFYWEELREALPEEFYGRIDAVRDDMKQNMDKIENFVRSMFDTGVAVAREENAKSDAKKETIVTEITNSLLDLI
jgi:hypothetical protein